MKKEGEIPVSIFIISKKCNNFNIHGAYVISICDKSNQNHKALQTVRIN